MNLIKMKYFLMFMMLCSCAAARAGNYTITDFGAKPDTSFLSTAAINQAIAACYKAGGGKVIIPAGNFKSGTIILKNNVVLYLESGATLFASTNPNDFPRQQQPVYRSQKDPGGWYALIYAADVVHTGICGTGIIDGQGALQRPRKEALQGDLDGRPRNILLISCKDVIITGITMRNAGIWNQHYLNCEDVMVDRIRVFNHSNRNNDGIDIDGCRRFILSNSIIDSDDDGIVMKSTGLAACEDIVINNCIVSSFTNAIKCGTESTGGFKNIAISNCTVKPSISQLPSVFGFSRNGITGISLEIVDGGIMDGVSVNNIVISGTDCPIYVRLGNRARPYKAGEPAPPVGQMRNISLANITAYNTGNYSSSITGVPGGLINDISLNNIRLVNTGGLQKVDFIAHAGLVKEDEKGYPEPTVWKNLPSYGLFIRHIGQLSLSNCSFGSTHPEIRKLIIGVDIKRLTIQNLTVDGNDEPKITLTQVTKFSNPNHIKVIP